MADNPVFRQLALDFGEAIRGGQGELPDTPAPLPWAALYDLLGPFGRFVRSVFERMEIAGQIIEEKKSSYPLQADLIDQSFPLLCGTEVLEQAPHRLYRKHCAEIIDRLVAGEDTKPATRAELVAALSGISFITPVKPFATCLYWRLFSELFPDDAQRIEDADLSDAMIFSSYDRREADELEQGLSRRLFVKDRILRP